MLLSQSFWPALRTYMAPAIGFWRIPELRKTNWIRDGLTSKLGEDQGAAYDCRRASSAKDGTENDTVTVRSGGCVPSRMAFARISIAFPARGGM
jgi:hypothetical protein